MRVALLTCSKLQGMPSDDDLLFNEFKRRGIACDWKVWDQPHDWSRYDYVIVRTTWDYIRQLAKFLETLQAITKVGCKLVNDYSLIEWNATKTYLYDLRKLGVPIIPSIFLNYESAISRDQLRKIQAEQYLVKPTIGANASDITIVDRDEIVMKISNLVANNDLNWFIQALHKEIYRGEISLIFYNDQFSHGVKKIPKMEDYRSQEEYGSQINPYKPNEKELAFCRNILGHLKHKTLFARIDYIHISREPHLMELEIIEPALYFRFSPLAAENFVTAFAKYIEA